MKKSAYENCYVFFFLLPFASSCEDSAVNAKYEIVPSLLTKEYSSLKLVITSGVSKSFQHFVYQFYLKHTQLAKSSKLLIHTHELKLCTKT